MKILQISPQVPFPLDNGGRLGIFGITESMSKRGHIVDFLTYNKGLDITEAAKALAPFATPHILDYQPDNRAIGALFNFFSKIPYNLSKFKTKKLSDFIYHYFRNNKPDIVHIDHSHMGWIIDIIKNISDVPIVLRQHNLELKIMQRFSEQTQNPLIKVYSKIQYKKFLKYEPALCEKFDNCIMITREDEKELLELNNKIKTSYIPAGVDSSLLKKKRGNIIPNSIIHLGSLNWLPNLDSITYFLNDIFPIILKSLPDSRLYVYGTGMDKLTIPESLKKNVIVKGYIKDIWQEISDKQIAVIPLRVGGGMRIKIIELMALGMPIVTTGIGKEGIDAENKKHLLEANTAIDFANSVLDLFSGKCNNSDISINSKLLVEEKYTWESVGARFEQLYKSLIHK